ncbi:hypothetical protein DITRI_Ditri16bG0009800 [Diplodiscus trichospermus]
MKKNQSGQDQCDEDVWSRPNWPPRLEKVLMELIIEEMNNHIDDCVSGFREDAWDRVCKEFNKETGRNFNKSDLKEHVGVLRKRYRIVKPLYDHGGFGWDYRRKVVDVDDCVWREYIEVYPQMKPYRKYGCPIYDELCTIFTKPKATGEHAVAIDATPEANLASKPKAVEIPQTDDSNTAGNCIAIINGMQGVDRCLYNAATDLFQNPFWRKTFLSLKGEKRLIWLKTMLPNA